MIDGVPKIEVNSITVLLYQTSRREYSVWVVPTKLDEQRPVVCACGVHLLAVLWGLKEDLQRLSCVGCRGVATTRKLLRYTSFYKISTVLVKPRVDGHLPWSTHTERRHTFEWNMGEYASVAPCLRQCILNASSLISTMGATTYFGDPMERQKSQPRSRAIRNGTIEKQSTQLLQCCNTVRASTFQSFLKNERT
jgi:hypothetical protein